MNLQRYDKIKIGFIYFIGKDGFILTKYEKSCGAMVYYLENNQPYYLVIQHRNGEHWAFTKGHVENDETEIDTALREINEETAVDVVNIDTGFRKVLSYSPASGVEKEVVYFVAEVESFIAKNVEKQEAEVLDTKWVSYDEAMDLVTYENDRSLLSEADQYIHDNKN